MTTVFSRIIAGEIPGRFVWSDDRCAAFLTIEPLQPGHVLVVPREEISHWVDLPTDLAGHVFAVAQTIGKAQQQAFERVEVKPQALEWLFNLCCGHRFRISADNLEAGRGASATLILPMVLKL